MESPSEDDEERKTNIIIIIIQLGLLYYESCHTLQATCKLSLPDLGLVTMVENAVVWSAGLLLFDRRGVEVAVGLGGAGPLPNILSSMALVLGRREVASGVSLWLPSGLQASQQWL